MLSLYDELIYKSLIALDPSIRVTILLESTMLGRLVVSASACRRFITSKTARLAALLTSLLRIDLAMSKLASADTTIRLAVLAETVVLCIISLVCIIAWGLLKTYQWACSQTC